MEEQVVLDSPNQNNSPDSHYQKTSATVLLPASAGHETQAPSNIGSVPPSVGMIPL